MQNIKFSDVANKIRNSSSGSVIETNSPGRSISFSDVAKEIRQRPKAQIKTDFSSSTQNRTRTQSRTPASSSSSSNTGADPLGIKNAYKARSAGKSRIYPEVAAPDRTGGASSDTVLGRWSKEGDRIRENIGAATRANALRSIYLDGYEDMPTNEILAKADEIENNDVAFPSMGERGDIGRNGLRNISPLPANHAPGFSSNEQQAQSMRNYAYGKASIDELEALKKQNKGGGIRFQGEYYPYSEKEDTQSEAIDYFIGQKKEQKRLDDINAVKVKYDSVKDNPDWEENSKYIKHDEERYEGVSGSAKGVWNRFAGTGSDEGVEALITYLGYAQKPTSKATELGAKDGEAGYIYGVLNPSKTDYENGSSFGLRETMKGAGYDPDLINNITTDEKSMLYYLFNTGRTADLKNYYDGYLKPTLEERETERTNTNAENAGRYAPISSSVMSIVSKPAETLEGGIALLRTISGDDAYDIKAGQKLTQVNQEIRNTVTNEFDTPVGRMLYGVGMSMADVAWTFAVSQLTGNVMSAIGGGSEAASAAKTVKDIVRDSEQMSLVLMSSEAASNELYNQMSEIARTGDDSVENRIKAVTLAGAAGFAEYITEKVSIESFLGDPKNILTAIGKQFISEGSEEMASDVINLFAEGIINGGRDEIYRRTGELMASGMSRDEASKAALTEWIKNTGYDGLAGGISGLFFGLGSWASASAQNRSNNRAYANAAAIEIMNQGRERIEYEIEEAKGYGEKSKIGRAAAKLNADNITEKQLSDILYRESNTKAPAVQISDVAQENAPDVFSEDKKGNILVATENGNERADKITNANLPIYTRFVYNDALEMKGENGKLDIDNANNYVKAYDGSDPDLYRAAYRGAYDAGRDGISFTDYQNGLSEDVKGLISEVSEKSQLMAWTQGQKANYAESQNVSLPSVSVSDIQNIRIEDGRTVIETKNGDTVFSDEANIPDERLKSLAEGAANYPSDVASRFVSYAYGKELSAVPYAEYAEAFNDVYNAGKDGTALEAVNGTNSYSVLGARAQSVFDMGRKNGSAESTTVESTGENIVETENTEAEASGKNKAGGNIPSMRRMSLRENGTFVDHTGTISESGMSFFRAVSESFGININVVNELDDGAWGEFTEWLNQMDLSKDSKNVYSTFLHETGHLIKLVAPEHFAKIRSGFRSYIIGKYGADTYAQLLDEKKKSYGTDSDEAAEVEVVCDQLEAVKSAKDFAKDMTETLHRQGYSESKIKKFFRDVADFLKRISDFISSWAQSKPVTMAGAAAQRSIEYVNKLEKNYISAMNAVGDILREARESGEGITTEGKTEKMYSPKYDFVKPFAEQIDDYKKGNFPKYDALIVCGTPEVFLQIGLPKLPMTYTQGHLKDALANTDGNHLGEKKLKMIPNAMKKPIAIISSSHKNDNRIVAIVDVSTKGNKSIAVVELDGKGMFNNNEIDSNAIVTIHTRKNTISKLLRDAVVSELSGQIGIFYWDKNRATQALKTSRVQFPALNKLKDGYVHSIRDSGSKVNAKFNNNTESVQFKRWFSNSAAKNTDGTPLTLYHQTSSDPFDTFDTSRKGAGYYDNELPSGIYMKDIEDTIKLGLDYDKSYQMPLYASIQNPLQFPNRAAALAYWKKNIPGYAALKAELDQTDEAFKKREKEIDDKYFLDDDIWDSETDKLFDEWEAKENEISRKMKTLLDDYLKNSKYDGIIIHADKGTGGTVKTYIALNNNQVKSTSNIGTYDSGTGNIYHMQPVSEAWAQSFMKELDEKDAKIEQLEKEHAEYVKTQDKLLAAQKKLNEALKRSIAAGDTRVVSFESTKDVVRRINEKLGVKLDYSNDTSELTKIYSALANVKTGNSDMIIDLLTKYAAERVIPKTYTLDDSVRRQFGGVLGEWRTKGIRLNDNQIAELEHRYGEPFGKVRNRFMGRVLFNKNGGADLDSSFAEWYNDNPGLFANLDSLENLSDADEVNYIIDAVERTKPFERSYFLESFGGDENAAARYIANELYNEYWNVEDVQTVSRAKTEAAAEAKAAYDKAFNEYKRTVNFEKKVLQNKLERSEKEFGKYRERTVREEYRGKIRRLYKYFSDIILHPTNTSRAPNKLYDAICEVCRIIDFTHNYDTKIGQKLLAVKKQFDMLGELRDSDFVTMYKDNSEISEIIQALANKFNGGNSLMEMSNDDLIEIYDTLNSLKGILVDARKQLESEERLSNRELASEFVGDQKTIEKRNQAASAILQETLNPVRAVNYLEDHRNGVMTRQLSALERGVWKAEKWAMEASKKFDSLREQNKGRDFRKFTRDAVLTELKDTKGNKVYLTHAQIAQIIMTAERERRSNYASSHLFLGGVTLPNLSDLEHGNRSKALQNSVRVSRIDLMDVSRLSKMLTEYDRAWIAAAEIFFNKDSAKALDEISFKLKHRHMLMSGYYIPYVVDKNFVVKEIDALSFNATLENAGFYKSVVHQAPQPLIIAGLDDVIQDHMKTVSVQYGLAIPIRNINKVYNANTFDGDSVKDYIKNNWKHYGGSGMNLVEQVITDLQKSRRGEDKTFLDSVRSGYIRAVLVGNLSVTLKQMASYEAAGLYLGEGAMWYGRKRLPYVLSHFKNVCKEIDEHTPVHYQRRKGLSTQELGDLSAKYGMWEKKGLLQNIKPEKWIQFTDCLTTAMLWEASKRQTENDIRRNKSGIKIGSEEYWNAVTEKYQRVIADTQPMYDVLHRTEITKKKNGVANSLLMFKTVPFQNYGILVDSFGELRSNIKAFNADSSEENRIRLTESRKKAARAAVRTLSGALVLGLMTIGTAFAMWRPDKYRDEYGDITLLSALLGLADESASAISSTLLPFSPIDVYGTTKDYVESGKTPELSEIPAVQVFNNTSKNLFGLIEDIEKIAKGTSGYKNASAAIHGTFGYGSHFLKLGTNIAAMFGIPADNAAKLVNAGTSWLTKKTNYNDSYERKAAQYYSGIYDNLISGDREKADNWYERARSKYSPKDIDSGIKKLLKNNEMLDELATAYLDNDFAKYDKLKQNLLDMGFSENQIFGARDANIKAREISEDDPDAESGEKKEYSSGKIAEIIVSGNADAIERISEWFAVNGSKGSLTAKIKPMYRDADERERAKIEKTLVNKFGYSEDAFDSWMIVYNYSDIYDAFDAGDGKSAKEVYDNFKENGKTDEQIQSAIKRHYKESYKKMTGSEMVKLQDFLRTYCGFPKTYNFNSWLNNY